MKTSATALKNAKKNRNWKIAAAIVALFLVVTLLSFTNHSHETTVNQAVKGQPIGDFSLSDILGNTHTLSEYQGKFVLINTWATWCPPCRDEMPDLEAYYRTYQDENFTILAINAGETGSVASAFAQLNNLTFPVLLDLEGETITAMGINGFPTSILVDPQGMVVHIHIGMFLPQDLEKEITPWLQNY
ncbi:MAG: hypothetical protein CVU39_04595 [Chloroflexi bacterium HGW-Chloroflexi-10]|nr:MAG: hypothetical protein CVU39_04595 [Chloroflexi bacterium HGW-Chloroflexi-10]